MISCKGTGCCDLSGILSVRALSPAIIKPLVSLLHICGIGYREGSNMRAFGKVLTIDILKLAYFQNSVLVLYLLV